MREIPQLIAKIPIFIGFCCLVGAGGSKAVHVMGAICFVLGGILSLTLYKSIAGVILSGIFLVIEILFIADTTK